jgi:hypothetical protein
MKFAKQVISLAVLLSQFGNSALAQKMPKPRPDSVSVALTSASAEGTLHWAITNHDEVAVYVYDFFLWGPALSVDHSPEKTTFTRHQLSNSHHAPRTALRLCFCFLSHRAEPSLASYRMTASNNWRERLCL